MGLDYEEWYSWLILAGKIRELQVAGRTSSFAFKGSGTGPADYGIRLSYWFQCER